MQLILLSFLFSLCVLEVVHCDCTTPLGVRSQCVSLYECNPLLSAFKQRPLPSHVVSYLKQSQCGFVGSIPSVCCGPLPANQGNRPQNTTPRPTRPTPSYSGNVESASREDSEPSPRGQCGQDTNGEKIYGGQFTELNEFPWMALLGYRTNKNALTYQCGGVLINRRYVLTAAHCVIGEILNKVGTPATARLGEYDTQTDQDCENNVCAEPHQDIPIHRTLPHSGYSDSNKNKQDDIALVRLARRVQYNDYVQPICLAGNTGLSTGDNVFVAGWGKTLNGRNSPVKLKLKLPIYDKANCKKKFQQLEAVLSDKQICAGGTFAEDSCQGDSGGPLMRYLGEGTWETVAVVSFGYGCGRDGWPGVYTHVAKYIDWIRSTIRSTNV